MIGNDSMYGFVIVLNSGYTCDITEYAWPVALPARCYQDMEYQSDQTIYYLRAREMPYGESFGMIWKRYYLEGATQMKTQNGGYIVTLGQYDTEEDAAPALKEKYGAAPDFFVSEQDGRYPNAIRRYDETRALARCTAAQLGATFLWEIHYVPF